MDLVSLSAHKFHGPKGIGALYVCKPGRFSPFVHGGGQEKGRRGGTENVTGIVGLGRAAALAVSREPEVERRIRQLRDDLERAVLSDIPDSWRNGGSEPRLPNTANLGFAGLEAEALVLWLDREEICVSTGSACTSGSLAPSHVLTAMGQTPQQAQGAIRISLGLHTTRAEVEFVCEKLALAVGELRRLVP